MDDQRLSDLLKNFAADTPKNDQSLSGLLGKYTVSAPADAQKATAPAADKPLLDRIRNHAETLRKAIAKRHVGQVRMSIGGIRHCLFKLYSEESDAVQFIKGNLLEGKKTSEECFAVANRLLLKVDRFLAVSQEAAQAFAGSSDGTVFIGHGRSPLWRELKDFLQDRLHLSWNEFNRDAVAGYSTFERLTEMLGDAKFAFLIMTAEDQHSDDSLHARENVVHEVGLFQGRLGSRRAIILLEEGCNEFSNIIGLCQIRFPKGHISAAFEEIRRVLEREGIVAV